MSDRVFIVPYDPAWPRQFEQERSLLAALFNGCDVNIEHVGSTAVPGLGAKPVIDIMVGVPALVDAERRITAFEAAGYDYVHEYEKQLPERRYFRKPRIAQRTFHVHCVVNGSDFWMRHLAFRDSLRAHRDLAVAYEVLKRNLAALHSKSAYTEAKSPFIERVLAAEAGDGEI